MMQLCGKMRFWGAILFVTFVILLFMPASIAEANAAPPPTRIWIAFYDQQDEPASPEGFQIIECKDENCNQPALLDMVGLCAGEFCLKPPVSSEIQQPLGCSRNTCFLMVSYDHDFAPYIKIIGTFSGKFLTSNPLKLDQITRRGSTLAWRVNILDGMLEIGEDAAFRSQIDKRVENRISGFPATFGITLIIESLIAGLVFWVKEIRNGSLWRMVGIVALVNLISYPLTWFLLPLLGDLQPVGDRNTGIVVLFVSAIFTLLLISIGITRGKSNRILVLITLIMLPICYAITGLILLANAYSYSTMIAVAGLPSNLIILLSEIFAVVFEGTLIYLLMRISMRISFKQAMLLSLAMNLASFIAGSALLLL